MKATSAMCLILAGILAAVVLVPSQPPTVVEAQTTVSDNPCYINNGLGSTATVQSANCRNRAGRVLGLRMVNTSGALAFLKLYNLAATPNCSSATGLQEIIPIPYNMQGGGIVDPTMNFFYNAGVSFCLVGGGTATDASAPPAGVYGTIRTGN